MPGVGPRSRLETRRGAEEEAGFLLVGAESFNRAPEANRRKLGREVWRIIIDTRDFDTRFVGPFDSDMIEACGTSRHELGAPGRQIMAYQPKALPSQRRAPQRTSYRAPLIIRRLDRSERRRLVQRREDLRMRPPLISAPVRPRRSHRLVPQLRRAITPSQRTRRPDQPGFLRVPVG